MLLSPTSSSSGGGHRRPHFFKVFVPALSSHQLAIPRAFAKHVAAAPQYVVLAGPSGRAWRVGFAGDGGGGPAFGCGWAEFAADHGLEHGDFLVFRYDGGARFSVLVFGPTACEKPAAFEATVKRKWRRVDTRYTHVKKSKRKTLGRSSILTEKESVPAEEQVNAGSLRGKSDATGTKRKRRSPRLASLLYGKSQEVHAAISDPRQSKPVISQKRMVADKDSTNVESEEEEAMEDEAASKVSVKRQQKVIQVAKRKKPRILYTHVTKIKRSESKSKEDTTSQCKFVQKERSANAQKKTRAGSSKGKRGANGTVRKRTLDHLVFVQQKQTRQGKAKPLREKPLTPPRRPVKDNEVHRALERANSFKSKNPFISVVMQDSYVYFGFLMYLPRPFVREHIPNSKTEMTLRDPQGRPWNVTYLSSGCFSAGWANFCRTNILHKGDVCIFELIRRNHVRVHIFRDDEECL